FTFRSFEMEENIYVQEVYCSNPECDCNEVHLVFYTLNEQGQAEERLVELRYDLILYEMKDIQIHSKRMNHKLFVEEFKKQIDGFQLVFNHHYRKVKEHFK